VYRPGDEGVTLPRPLRQGAAQYTSESMRRQIEGVVAIELIVRDDGTLTDARILRSLDPHFGLDEQAYKAALEWRFVPGSKDGKPVNVRVTIESRFCLSRNCGAPAK
jgi:TonB family protein